MGNNKREKSILKNVNLDILVFLLFSLYALFITFCKWVLAIKLVFAHSNETMDWFWSQLSPLFEKLWTLQTHNSFSSIKLRF